ncbi:leucine-rich receptor-like protein kinase family protein, partial [Striga asiatica]
MERAYVSLNLSGYAQTRRVNEKIDVYGFGVILLELVTGREAPFGDETLSIVDWTWRHVCEGRPVEDTIDEDIRGTVYLEQITTVLRLGLMCTSAFPSNRPAMNDVLQILLRCGQRLLSEKKVLGTSAMLFSTTHLKVMT